MLQYAWYFFIYAFLGWCTEVVFAAIKNGQFVNRGFLNGPICPIYGCGMVAVLLCLRPFGGNLIALYVGSVVLTTVIELLTGFVMEKLFHQRWWDYSQIPLNIGGYVCPLFSLIWGVACVLIVDVLHPHIAALVESLMEPFGKVMLCVFAAVLVTDLCATIATVARLNRRLRMIDDVSTRLREISNGLGEAMAEGALALKATDDIACDELQFAREHAHETFHTADETMRAELAARYGELVERLELGQRRILKAFPRLRSIYNPSALEAIRDKLGHLLNNKKPRA